MTHEASSDAQNESSSERIGRYHKFPTRQEVADALVSLGSPGARDEGIVMIVARAYVEGDLVGARLVQRVMGPGRVAQ